MTLSTESALRTGGQDRLTRAMLGLLIITVVFGQRFVLPVQDFQIPIVLFIAYGVLTVLVLRSRAKLDILRFVLFTLSVGLMMLNAILFSVSYSELSLWYLFVSYIPLLFVIPDEEHGTFQVVLNQFQVAMVWASVIGILQFGLQLVGVPYQDLFSMIPSEYVQQGFNTSYPVRYGSALYKSNAVFFLEPSTFSQFAATAFIAELLFFKKIYRAVLYFLGLLVSFSGTGLVLFLVFLLPALRKLSKQQLGSLAIVLTGIVVWFSASGHMGTILARVAEFQSDRSSAYIRFIAPYQAWWQLANTPVGFLVGVGAGTFQDTFVHQYEPVIPKLMSEYGLFAGFLFVVFLVVCFFRKPCSHVLAGAMALKFFLLSGSLLQPQVIYFTYVLSSIFSHRMGGAVIEGRRCRSVSVHTSV